MYDRVLVITIIRIIQKYRVPVPRYFFSTVPVPRYNFSKVPSTCTAVLLRSTVPTNAFKTIIRPYWNMQTPYGALSYQTPTSRNYKPIRTQLCSCYWLQTRQKGHRFHIFQGLQHKTSVLPKGTHLKLHANYL